ncbi:MAG: PD-(D/E)XK nuclease family protein [Halioglobus sp.]|nr:PD-(D/E)XK nuclease family protein [Halioglobus sp.]
MAHRLYDISTLEPFAARGCVLLTPNTRLARRIRQEWAAARVASGASVWESPAVFPLERWLQQRWDVAVREGLLPPLLPLNAGQERAVWEQVILEDLGDADPSALIDPAGAAELAAQARDLLLRWQLDSGDAAVASVFATQGDCARFLAWREAFDLRLQQQGQCTAVDCLQALAHLQKQPGLPPAVLLEAGELAPLVRMALATQTSHLESLDPGGADSALVLHPFADTREEIRGVAAWAARQQRTAPDDTLAIVFSGPDADRVALEYHLRREFDCLGEDYNSLPVNFSTGIPLAHAPVIRDALALLALVSGRVAVTDVVALFRSRFVDLPDVDTADAQAFLRRLLDGGSEELEVGALRHFANRPQSQGGQALAFGARLMTVAGMRELRQRHRPSDWVTLVSRVLDVWGWPGSEPLDSLEFQQVSRWYATLDEFCALDAVCPALEFSRALQLLRDSCRRQVSHPQTADSAVQVLGPLEAAGLAFDHLWIVGAQSNTWPAPARPNPLIPVSLQAERGMPHATPEREWRYAQDLLGQYRRGCGTVHASYSTQMDGVEDRPGALLHGATDSAKHDVPALVPEWVRRQGEAARVLVSDHLAPAVGDAELDSLRGGAALVESQSQCPFRAFARHRLRVSPLADFSVGIAAAERGHIVHEALQVLWSVIGDQAALLAMAPAQLAAAIDKSVTVGLEALPDHRRIALGSACVELEAQRLRALLEQWLEVERQRGAFVVAAMEQDITASLSRLELNLRVDRIDELPDGSRVIIDYKTGVARASDWLGERPARPQLLLYGLCVDAVPAALAFARLRPSECAYVGLGEVDSIPGINADIHAATNRRGEAFADWSALNDSWRDTLQRLAQQFLDGDAAVDPQPNSCDYCGLQALCRVDGDLPPSEPA